jgi:hypothetical protein
LSVQHNEIVFVRRSLRPGTLALVAWLGTVAVLAGVRAATGWAAADTLAASPDALATGRLWLLASSGVIVSGALPALQIAAMALLAWMVLRRFGPRVFWAIAIAAHVGTTLITYAGIGALWLVDAHAARPVLQAPDYGISAVWAGCAGGLAVAGILGAPAHRRLALALGAACLLVFAVLVPADGELADVEHLVAFTVGATVAAVALHHGARAHRLPLRPARLSSLRRRPPPASWPLR